jgi:hypothetical protein
MMREPPFPPQGNQPPMLFQANEPLAVTLSAQEWNVVLGGLYELPYRVASQVIDNVRMQLYATAPRVSGASGLSTAQREQG